MGDMESNRRSLLIAAPLLLSALAATDKTAKTGKTGNIGDINLSPPPKSGPDPAETFVRPYEQIGFQPWGNLPPGSGEMAMLYGDFNQPGPYLVMMKWNPGWFSAPHTYATDRIQVVVFGTWFVSSGNDFQPQDAVPVGPGGYVRRTARTPHYDGVPANQPDPAVIAIFGLGPVDIRLVDPTQRPGVRCDNGRPAQRCSTRSIHLHARLSCAFASFTNSAAARLACFALS